MKNNKKEFTNMVIFSFCYSPVDQSMTFAGNINIIDAVRLLQNKVFDSIAFTNPDESDAKEA